MKTIKHYFSKVCVIALLTIIVASCGSDDDNKLPEQFTVTFDSQGGSNVSPQTVNDGAKIKEPTAPTKDKSLFMLNGNKSITQSSSTLMEVIL